MIQDLCNNLVIERIIKKYNNIKKKSKTISYDLHDCGKENAATTNKNFIHIFLIVLLFNHQCYNYTLLNSEIKKIKTLSNVLV